MRISDWSSDCALPILVDELLVDPGALGNLVDARPGKALGGEIGNGRLQQARLGGAPVTAPLGPLFPALDRLLHHTLSLSRSEEHTSELQSLMRISYAVFCLKKNTTYTR